MINDLGGEHLRQWGTLAPVGMIWEGNTCASGAAWLSYGRVSVFSGESLPLILCVGLQDSPCYEELLANRRRVPRQSIGSAWRLA